MTSSIRIHFSDYFGVSPEALASHGAFNISLINDLPLFVDPFLLFNSSDPEYLSLHAGLIRYLRFLRDKALSSDLPLGLLTAWFTFPEVKQNWLGYSLAGNAGSGLGVKFARSLHRNLNTIFTNFGAEEIARGSHLEKLCLIDHGVGRDNISDFVVNLIKEYLLRFTQTFARAYLKPEFRRTVPVPRVRFQYSTETWETDTFELPWNDADEDFVLLTPKNLLTKDDVWISRAGLFDQFEQIVDGMPNDQLRAQVNNYLLQQLPREASAKERDGAVAATLRRFPAVIEYYIRSREDRGDDAAAASDYQVRTVETLFVKRLTEFTNTLARLTPFYAVAGDTYREARERVLYLKDVIESKGGHGIFWMAGEPIRRESDLHILFRLCWMGTPSDVSTEVDDGRGPADYKISRGAFDKTIIEFKLASNTKLKGNLKRQAEIYQSASNATGALKVIVYFTESELRRVRGILEQLGLSTADNVILIDARRDNKPSASKA